MARDDLRDKVAAALKDEAERFDWLRVGHFLAIPEIAALLVGGQSPERTPD